MGFYEDNINMVINTFSSFNSSFPFYASKSKPTSSNILLIGSGPSLDTTFREISDLKDRFNPTIVCCGSAVTIS